MILPDRKLNLIWALAFSVIFFVCNQKSPTTPNLPQLPDAPIDSTGLFPILEFLAMANGNNWTYSYRYSYNSGHDFIWSKSEGVLTMMVVDALTTVDGLCFTLESKFDGTAGNCTGPDCTWDSSGVSISFFHDIILKNDGSFAYQGGPVPGLFGALNHQASKTQTIRGDTLAFDEHGNSLRYVRNKGLTYLDYWDGTAHRSSSVKLNLLEFNGSEFEQPLDFPSAIDAKALSYYPLQIGNYWEYHAGDRHINVKVASDTLLPNGKQYRVIISRSLPDQEILQTRYERIDSLDAKIYRFTSDNGEYIIDDLKAPPLKAIDTFRFRQPGSGAKTMFLQVSGYRIGEWFFHGKYLVDVDAWHSLSYGLARNIGLYRFQSAPDQPNFLLTYAKIGELEVGAKCE